MALLTISGSPASRWEEVAHGAAQLLGFPLITESRLAQGIAREFGDIAIPARAWAPAAICVLAPQAREQHLVIAVDGAGELFGATPSVFRVCVEAPDARRAGNLMVDRGLDKAAAVAGLRDLDLARKRLRKARFGKIGPVPAAWDLALHLARVDVAEATDILAAAAAKRLEHHGMLTAAAADELIFAARLQLARRAIVPTAKAEDREAASASFGHPSEKMFANLLDFYRIEWEYEPRTFSLQWNKAGEVTEAFTPDFYLPQFDLYVELTTMKQSLVTKKNRKVKLLRAIYPHINIQVFYQKDFQDLISKYSLKMAV